MANNSLEVVRFADLGSAAERGKVCYVSGSTAAVNGIYYANGTSWTHTFFEDGTQVNAGALTHTGSTAGFYGTTPIAKQTGVAVTAGAVHAALVALGLIGA